MRDVSRLEPRARVPLGSGRLPLGVQVVAAVGALVVLLVIAVLIGVFLVRGLSSDTAELTDQEVEYALAIDAAALAAKGMANDERGFLLSGNDAFLTSFDQRAERVRASFAAALRAADSAEQRHAVREARDGFEQWVRAVRREVATFENGAREAAVTAALGPTRDLRYSYEASLRGAQGLGTRAIESGSESVSSASSQSIAILVAYLVAALLVAGLIALWLVRTILRPVYALLALFAEPGSADRLVERYSRAARSR